MNHQELRTRLSNSLRTTLEAILGGFIYRNFGEMPYYETPISNLMTTLGWENLNPEQTEWHTQIILAIFDGRDYPGRGTFPDIETPIHQTMVVLSDALDATINRHRELYRLN